MKMRREENGIGFRLYNGWLPAVNTFSCFCKDVFGFKFYLFLRNVNDVLVKKCIEGYYSCLWKRVYIPNITQEIYSMLYHNMSIFFKFRINYCIKRSFGT